MMGAGRDAMGGLVVFDLDGTLVDSRLDLANSVNEMLEGFGARPLPVGEVAAMVGEGARVLVRRALAAADRDVPIDEALSRFRLVYDRRLLEHTRPYPGVADTVRGAAARAALAVLTNKPTEPARRLLEAFDLAASFTWVVGGDSPFPRKPDPAALRHLMEQAGSSTRTTLMIGDSMIDVETARQGGVRVCVARYGFGDLRGELVLTGDDLVAQTPAEVATHIARWADSAGV
jgi:phosphoglycolate phosphatase